MTATRTGVTRSGQLRPGAAVQADGARVVKHAPDWSPISERQWRIRLAVSVNEPGKTEYINIADEAVARRRAAWWRNSRWDLIVTLERRDGFGEWVVADSYAEDVLAVAS